MTLGNTLHVANWLLCYIFASLVCNLLSDYLFSFLTENDNKEEERAEGSRMQ